MNAKGDPQKGPTNRYPSSPHTLAAHAFGALVGQPAPSFIGKTADGGTLALADLAAGRPVAHASTRAYGCSVKYAD